MNFYNFIDILVAQGHTLSYLIPLINSTREIHYLASIPKHYLIYPLEQFSLAHMALNILQLSLIVQLLEVFSKMHSLIIQTPRLIRGFTNLSEMSCEFGNFICPEYCNYLLPNNEKYYFHSLGGLPAFSN